MIFHIHFNDNLLDELHNILYDVSTYIDYWDSPLITSETYCVYMTEDYKQMRLH